MTLILGLSEAQRVSRRKFEGLSESGYWGIEKKQPMVCSGEKLATLLAVIGKHKMYLMK